MNPRSWYYQDKEKFPNFPDFANLYRDCDGTILFRSDCGSQSCGSADCCHSTGEDSFIFFLPGEFEFQTSQDPAIPFHSVSEQFSDRFHCSGNADCIYEARPLDCRSYPYFPAVIDMEHVGYFDCRRSHACPLRIDLELRDHLKKIHKWWRVLLKNEEVKIWANAMSRHCKSLPIMEIPEFK